MRRLHLLALFRLRGVSHCSEFFTRVSERHPACLPAMVQILGRFPIQPPVQAPGIAGLKVRGRWMDRAGCGHLSSEGWLDHPLSGPREELYWRRMVVSSTEPPRSQTPVVDSSVMASYGATFEIEPRLVATDPEREREILDLIGLGPNGRPWDCRACGFDTCAAFARAAAVGRASMRQCTPYQTLRMEVAERDSAVDALTGVAAYRVLTDRLQRGRTRLREAWRFPVLFIDSYQASQRHLWP
jgi:hypothetical protein